MSRKVTLIAALVLFSSTQASALSCNPRDVTARILKTPNPNDIHPDWQGGSNIGTAWTLSATGRVQSATGTYLKGNLLSPRGGVINRGVFIMPAEWDCSQ
jgi:hypothetical protein